MWLYTALVGMGLIGLALGWTIARISYASLLKRHATLKQERDFYRELSNQAIDHASNVLTHWMDTKDRD